MYFSSGFLESVKNKTCEALKIKEFAFANDCFSGWVQCSYWRFI